MSDRALERLLPACWLLWAAAAVIIRLLSTGILEAGDGVQHYQIARGALQHPLLLLDHWGKPLFTLFSMPFAQLGPWGMTLFNSLCFLLTCWLADGVLRRSGNLARILFAPALMLVPAYGSMVLAGMTEVLFGLLTIVVLRALYEERYVLAAMTISFMPFARPEAIAVAPFFILWLVKERQWRALPWLIFGNALYALVGRVVFGDLLWYFNRDPYQGASETYGRGELLHFVDQLDRVIGGPIYFLLLGAMLLFLIYFVADASGRRARAKLFVLTLAPAFAILALHSFLWWKGLKGSLGLTRVLATGVPLALIFTCSVWSTALLRLFTTRVGQWTAGVIFGGILLRFSLVAFQALHSVPLKADDYQAFLATVGERVQHFRPRYDRVKYFHPYLGYRADLNPFDTTSAVHCSGLNMTPEDPGLRTGELLVWDSHFGPNEGRTPLDELLRHPDLRLVEACVPRVGMKVLGGHWFEVMLLARGPNMRSEPSTWYEQHVGSTVPVGARLDTLRCSEVGTWCFSGSEFPMELSAFPLNDKGVVMTTLTISGSFRWANEPADGVNLVFTEEEEGSQLSYWSEKLGEGEFSFTFHAPARSGRATNKVYFWNSSGKPFRVQGLKVEATRYLAP